MVQLKCPVQTFAETIALILPGLPPTISLCLFAFP